MKIKQDTQYNVVNRHALTKSFLPIYKALPAKRNGAPLHHLLASTMMYTKAKKINASPVVTITNDKDLKNVK